ncbi:MAG TPA: F0F1 ATP synthase subunit delta [Trebonia sp.]|jgi:F-type H+-transporting ATPase subunit delta
MRGASRASYAQLRDRLAAVATGPRNSAEIGDQLFSVVRLLDSEHGLRRALADATKPADEKSAVVRRLLHGKVSTATEGLVADAAAARWASSGDFADALEQLAIEALTAAAQHAGTLDDLEDDLFRFARLVSGQAGLRLALIGATSPEAKASLLSDLLSDKISGPSLSLITQVLTHPRGRSPQAALDLAASIAARRREQLIAVVRVATELSAAQRQRLHRTLTEAYGQGIHVNIVHDPAVVGGLSVQVGDELIDGTAATRLAEVRRRLAG